MVDHLGFDNQFLTTAAGRVDVARGLVVFGGNGFRSVGFVGHRQLGGAVAGADKGLVLFSLDVKTGAANTDHGRGRQEATLGLVGGEDRQQLAGLEGQALDQGRFAFHGECGIFAHQVGVDADDEDHGAVRAGADGVAGVYRHAQLGGQAVDEDLAAQAVHALELRFGAHGLCPAGGEQGRHAGAAGGQAQEFATGQVAGGHVRHARAPGVRGCELLHIR